MRRFTRNRRRTIRWLTISAVNRYLADNIPANRFVTLFYAELDPESGSLSFLNAGHNPPLIVHAAGLSNMSASVVCRRDQA